MGAEASIFIENAPPTVRAAWLERPAQRPHLVDLHVEATDPDHDALDYDVEWRLDGRPWPGAYGMRVDVSRLGSGRKVEALLRVSDGQATIERTVRGLDVDNQPPSLDVAAKPTIEDGGNGRVAVLEASSVDPDGDTVAIAAIGAPAGVRWDDNRQALVWPVQDGSEVFDVVLRADDHRGGQAERTLTLRR